MTDLPAWLQEIRDRVDKATPGPWRVVAHGEQDCLARREITAGKHIMIARVDCVPGVAADFDRDYAFIAHARTDVPRLLKLIEKLADTVQALVDTKCEGMSCISCNNTECLSGLWGQAYEVLAEYRGEVENNG